MEREYGEFEAEIREIGISEIEEDKAVENPTVTIKQQLKKAKNASKVVQTADPLYQQKSGKGQKSQKTVFKSPQKKKEVIFAE